MGIGGRALRAGALLGFWAGSALAQAVAINISGTVTDSSGTTPIASATVKLETLGTTATTDASGAFKLGGATAIAATGKAPAFPAGLRDGRLRLVLPMAAKVSVQAFGAEGRLLGSYLFEASAGPQSFPLPGLPAGLCYLKAKAGDLEAPLLRALSVDGRLREAAPDAAAGEAGSSARALGKAAATAIYDVLIVEKAGYQKAYLAMTNSDSTGVKIKMLKEGAAKFSFFVTSQKILQELSKSDNGFGGDFRFGETGPGAGLRGADKLCAAIAERSMPGSSVKGWRAFLSATADARGKQVDAITRIGQGPWYDRAGRLLAPTVNDLKNTRPMNGDPSIQNDLPNENGIPNHRPDPSRPADDNHHMVTGSSTSGTLASATATCKDWTSADGATGGKPSCGFAWPRGSGTNGANWMSTFNAQGCAPGYHFDNSGGQASATGAIIGSNGGYGGFYCFALNP